MQDPFSSPSLLAESDLVIITLDCVRPDFLGCYGCETVRTPNLDRLASCGLVFEQAASQAPNTWVSHAGILTGLYPPLHGLRSPYDRLCPDVPTLASVLAAYGYATAGFPGNDLVGSRMGFQKGFDLFFEQYSKLDVSVSEGLSANNRNTWEEVLEAAADWLVQQKSPVFLWFHYLDTHHLPSLDLPDFYRFSRDPLWQFYEGKISYADERCVGRVIDLTQSTGRYENTVFVVLSDHGEELRPGTAPSHNGELSEEALRIPLILCCEKMPWKGMRVPDLVRTADLAPTLSGVLCSASSSAGGEFPKTSGSPLPLQGLDEKQVRKASAGDLAYAENEPLGLFSVRTGEWKYRVKPEREELFHLPTDPREMNNVIQRHPETAAYLSREMKTIRSCQPLGERTPADREEMETRRLLRDFGYLE